MSAPHDAPNSMELLEAVREWIDREVIPSTDGRLRFHARVASNVLAMVEREIDVGPVQEQRHHERLAILGVGSDEELAAAIRERRFDDRADELRELLFDMVADKLSVANPGYLDPT